MKEDIVCVTPISSRKVVMCVDNNDIVGEIDDSCEIPDVTVTLFTGASTVVGEGWWVVRAGITPDLLTTESNGEAMRRNETSMLKHYSIHMTYSR